MRLGHAEPRIGARPTGVLTQLIDELLGQSVQVGPGELLIDAVVLPRAIIKSVGDCRMASTPPSRSYRESSTVPASCALVTNGSAMFPAPRILKPCNPGQVNLYLLLTRRTRGPGSVIVRAVAADGGGQARKVRQGAFWGQMTDGCRAVPCARPARPTGIRQVANMRALPDVPRVRRSQ
jgi:hypothetical protein